MSTELTYDAFDNLLAGYVVGALDPDEMLAVAAFIDAHPEVEERVAEAEEAIAQLAMLAPNAALPSDGKQRLLDRAQNATVMLTPRESVRPSTPSTSQTRPAPHSITHPSLWDRVQRLLPALRWGVAFAMIAGLLVWNLRLQSSLSTLEQAIDSQGTRISLMIDTSAAPNASGRLFVPNDGTSGVITVTGLPPLPPGKDYQFWFARPDKSRDSAAVFNVGANGDALIPVTIPQNLTQYDQIWITQEPDGGSAVPTAPHYLEGPLVQ